MSTPQWDLRQAGHTKSVTTAESAIIMKQNTIYCLRATASAAGYIDFDMQWYECVT